MGGKGCARCGSVGCNRGRSPAPGRDARLGDRGRGARSGACPCDGSKTAQRRSKLSQRRSSAHWASSAETPEDAAAHATQLSRRRFSTVRAAGRCRQNGPKWNSSLLSIGRKRFLLSPRIGSIEDMEVCPDPLTVVFTNYMDNDPVAATAKLVQAKFRTKRRGVPWLRSLSLRPLMATWHEFRN